jgi:hypothetical protein
MDHGGHIQFRIDVALFNSKFMSLSRRKFMLLIDCDLAISYTELRQLQTWALWWEGENHH